MWLGSVKLRLTEENISSQNLRGRGIYVLFNSYRDIVFIGKSDQNLEKSLLSHLSSEEMLDEYYFSAKMTESHEDIFNNIINAYKEAFYGRVPDGLSSGKKINEL